MPSPDHDPAAEPVATADPLAAPVARAVAEDLEAIFPQDAPRPAAGRRRLKLEAGRERDAARRRRGLERRAASLGALVAAACLGLSAGALVARTGAPLRSAPPSVSPGVPITVAQASLPSPGPLPEAPAVPPPSPAVAPLEAAQPADPSAAAADAAPAAPRHGKPARTARHHGRSAVLAADARLRRAYASAERAGVAYAVLADYRDEWSRLRRRAPRQPVLVAARYRQMAGELNHMAARERTARAEPLGPWRRFRTQLAALWR
jgi:hypothetical protein